MAAAAPPRIQDGPSPDSGLRLTADASTEEPVATAASPAAGFVVEPAFSGLTLPTMIRFAPDGRIFVAEKAGRVKVYSSLTDTTPDLLTDRSASVYSYWDRGLLGLAVDPNFPAEPWVYLLYTTDIAGYNDACPSPPGPTNDGCMANGRLSRIQVSAGNTQVGSEQILLDGYWCQQYPSHSIGTIEFGADGALYVGAGDGASFTFTDYGQGGGDPGSPTPANPCGDPPSGVGGTQSPPTAQGGSLRSQDLRTSGDPVGYDGTILRVNPDTAAAFPGNPLIGGTDAIDDRIVAYGLRNPFRFTVKPGTNELWIGDVGQGGFEEINRVVSPTGGVTNFGWPCYEGTGRQPGYDSANLDICENLYGQGGATAPFYSYEHGVAVAGCPGTTSSVSGLAFYQGGAYPSQYAGALFFSDYSRQCIWVMYPGAGGTPNPATLELFASAAPAVALQLGSDGNLYYVDHLAGIVYRIRSTTTPANRPPVAVASANPTSGPAPLTVAFTGTGSSDPDGDPLTYAWDLDGDGQTDDSTSPTPTWTYSTAATTTVTLRIDDGRGGTNTTTLTITATNPTTGDGSVRLPGTAGTYISAPDRPVLDVTGDLDIRTDVALDNWATTSAKLVTKLGDAYEFMLNGTTKGLRLAWYETGGALRIRNSTATLTAANGQRLQLRATLDVDNGAGGHTVTFYSRTDTSRPLTDDTGWTQLGTPLTVTGTSSIRAGTSTIVLGSHVLGDREYWAGNYYRALILAGIGNSSPTAANPTFTTTTQLTSTPPDYTRWTDTATNPWTIQGTGWTYNP
jgi:glucose/arabinose dehydrogenase/PKD repeat protein